MKNIQQTLPSAHLGLKVRTHLRTGRLETREDYAHWHNEMELVYARRGTGLQQINGIFFELRPGTVSVIGPNQLHSFVSTAPEEEFDLLVLQFDVAQLLVHFSGETQFCGDWSSGRLLFPDAVDAAPRLGDLMEDIHREITGREAGYEQAVTGALLQLLPLLYRRRPQRLSSAELEAASGQRRKLLSQVFPFLAEHYQQEDLSLQQAAQAANLSVTHFCRVFKLATGMSFHEYLNYYRILQAERLFPTSKSLLEIAYTCGFGSLSTFTRNYKKYRNIPPQQARKR